MAIGEQKREIAGEMREERDFDTTFQSQLITNDKEEYRVIDALRLDGRPNNGQEQVTVSATEAKSWDNARPTLVIGLGGTGHFVLVHLKARMIRTFGADGLPPTFRLLVFDTTDESLTVNVDGYLACLEKGSELFNIGHTPVPNIIRNLGRNTAIQERLGPIINALPPVVLRSGAKQIRPLGLLALLWRYGEVEQRIRDAIWELAGRDNLQGQEIIQAQGINVFIVNSLVGGTGSGIFLDVAYLVRSFFEEMGSMGDFCYITGVGVLPQAFRGIEGPNIAPNTVAALLELNQCMIHGSFSARYPNGRVVIGVSPPFNIYYLVDGVDERGYTWQGLNELCAMTAEGLYLQIGSQLGRKGENDFDNTSDILARQTESGEGTFYGSFGLASFVFPAERVVDICAHRYAQRLIEEGLLRPADEAVVEQEAAEFWRARRLELSALLAELSQDDQGVTITVRLEAPAWLNRLKAEAIPQESIRYAKEYERVRLNRDYKLWMGGNYRDLQHELLKELYRYVEGACHDQGRGLDHARRFLATLGQRLHHLTVQVDAQRETYELECSRVEQEIPHLEESLLRAAEANFLVRSSRVASAQSRYFKAYQDFLAHRFQAHLHALVLNLLAHLHEEVVEVEGQVSHLCLKLRSAQRLLADEEQALTKGQSKVKAIVSLDLADPAYLEQLYQRYAPPVEGVIADLLSREPILLWQNDSLAQVAERVLENARAPFLPVLGIRLEDIIAERQKEMSPQARKELLFQLATPAWNLDLTRIEDGGASLQTIAVMGVDDENDSIYRESKPMLVSTHDPHRITALLATMGAPHTALQQYPNYLRVYERVKAVRPLHVLPGFQMENRQGRLAFALGSLFGFIFNQGSYFYYRPLDDLDRPERLANGLANSVREFCAREGLSKEVLERVNKRIAEEGIGWALERLEGYCQASGDGASPTDDLTLEMKKLVRSYAEELHQAQQFNQMGG